MRVQEAVRNIVSSMKNMEVTQISISACIDDQGNVVTGFTGQTLRIELDIDRRSKPSSESATN